MAEVLTHSRWITCLLNNSDQDILLHKVELYYDGGEEQALNKREAIISFYVGSENAPESELLEVNFPFMDGETPNIKYQELTSETDYFSEVSDIDLYFISRVPIIQGHTKISPDSILKSGEKLFIGAKSKVDGNITIVVKGLIYDKQKQDSDESDIKKPE